MRPSCTFFFWGWFCACCLSLSSEPSSHLTLALPFSSSQLNSTPFSWQRKRRALPKRYKENINENRLEISRANWRAECMRREESDFKPLLWNHAVFSIQSLGLLSHLGNELISHLECEWRRSGWLITVLCILCLLNEGNRCEHCNMLRVLQYSRGTCRESSLH